MTVVVGTNSYLSIAAADAYWQARDSSAWSSADTATKEKALLQATQYIDGAYSFIGTQIITNVLAWPRDNAYIERGNFAGITYLNNVIPPQIENACAELAFAALTSDLAPDLERGGAIKREKVDVIEVEYSDFAPSVTVRSMANLILSPLTKGSKSNARLSR